MDKIIYEKVGQRLKQARELRHITLEEAGKKVDVHKSTVLRWENGETEKFKIPTLEILANYYNVNPAWLMGYDVPMQRTFNENKQQENLDPFISEDDAMYPLLDIGDIAYIYKQNTIDETNPSSSNAGTYLIEMDNQRTIRRFIESQDKTYYTLQAMNISCKPIHVNKEELQQKITIVGKVIRIENSSAFK